MPPVPLGLYVHVPFCARTCDYCAFYQISPTGESIQRFLAGIAAEAAGVAWTRPVATVFWGGGTPGLLAARDLRRLGETVRARVLADSGIALAWEIRRVGVAGGSR